MTYDFTQALIGNIERTYTYAYVKNAYGYKEKPEKYDAMDYFCYLLEKEPFDAMMALDGFAFKRAKNTLDKYAIPYTEEQERRARVYFDVTEKMKKERSDYVSLFVENFERTGVVKVGEPFILTTSKTIELARFIKELPRIKSVDNMIYENELDPLVMKTKEQLEAIKTCVLNQVSCLIGGAGTGKSFVTAQIIKQFQANDLSVVVLAPTHKAREALQSKMDSNGVRGKVRTIHSFVHNPEECDVIVIDESGMLSTPLLHALFQNAYEGQQLVFVGDKNQLPPVEYGRPFEKIQELFVVAELKKNHRSESEDIIALGREILGVPQNANREVRNIEVVNDIKSAFEKGAEVLLSFTNADVKITNEVRKLKNAEKSISPYYSIGDVVIAKTNERDRDFYNGQIFEVTGYDTLRNKQTGRVVRLKTAKDLEFNFDLAYGLTIHKSQGSEWDTVAYKPSSLDTQNLAYVAVTRAKKKLIIVGDGMKATYPTEKEWKQLDEIDSI